MPSPYVSNSCGFSLHLGGGGRKDIYTGPATQGVACRYGIAVGLLTVRPGRYGKDRRAGRQGKQGVACRYGIAVGLPSPCAHAGTARKQERAGKENMGVACRYGIVVGLLTVRPGRYGKGRRAGLAEGLQGRSVRGRQLHYAHTSQPADHINRQLVKQQRRYLFKA
jgi:hypothetical protein